MYVYVIEVFPENKIKFFANKLAAEKYLVYINKKYKEDLIMEIKVLDLSEDISQEIIDIPYVY